MSYSKRNNAGIAVLAPIDDLTLEGMRAAGGGSLINLSSVAGLVGLARCVAYGAAKGGVRIMTKSIAIEGARDNIRCNSVHTGVIWTNMQAEATGAEFTVDAGMTAQ